MNDYAFSLTFFSFHIFVAHSRDLFQSQFSYIYTHKQNGHLWDSLPLQISERGAQSPPTLSLLIMQYAWFFQYFHNTTQHIYSIIPYFTTSNGFYITILNHHTYSYTHVIYLYSFLPLYLVFTRLSNYSYIRITISKHWVNNYLPNCFNPPQATLSP